MEECQFPSVTRSLEGIHAPVGGSNSCTYRQHSIFKAHEVKRLSGGGHRGGRRDVFDQCVLYTCMKFPNKLKTVGVQGICFQLQITTETITSLLHTLYDPMDICGNQTTRHKILTEVTLNRSHKQFSIYVGPVSSKKGRQSVGMG